jgi:TM2 domain-containing membrane protein YozV
MKLGSKLLSVVCAVVIATSGCVTVPKIEGDMEAKLNKLEAAGKPARDPKSAALAGVLNIIPGVGQMYAGDTGDGVLTLLTFWLVYPYIMGFVDAVAEARVFNAKYTIAFYEKEGFKFSLRLFDQAPEMPPAYSLLPLVAKQ